MFIFIKILGRDVWGNRVFVMIPALLDKQTDKDVIKQYLFNKLDPLV